LSFNLGHAYSVCPPAISSASFAVIPFVQA
jgi:hypothetical protein